MFGFGKKPRLVNLALQGGGAHGAFTWGVLDRLLEEPGIAIGWISGTSAGAVNAVATASGLATGGKEAARETLQRVWGAVAEAGVPDLLRLNPFLAGMSRSQTLGQMASLFSPYQFNPLGFDPLRKLLDEHIDFARIRATDGPELLIAATDVATGRSRLFRRKELTVEAVLASACLPTLHHAVQIGGRAYWDGGFSANPDMLTLASESPIGDTLLVLLNPIEKSSMPRSAREIAAEVSRVTFTQPLLREIAEIAAIGADYRGGLFSRRTRSRAIARHRFHMIEAGRHTGALPADSKLRPDKSTLTLLHNAGRDEARKWIGRHLGDLGRRATIDLGTQFLGPLVALPLTPSGAETVEDDDQPANVPNL